MTKRDPHADNALIDQLQAEGAPSQSGRSGGNVNRDVGTRTELHETVRDVGMERPTGQDNPAQDAVKGDKTRAKLQPGSNQD